jgi:ribosomal protein L11 methylase PrmA
MLDVVARQTDDSDLRLLDLCCGTGSISRRVLARFRSASILAVDTDPPILSSVGVRSETASNGVMPTSATRGGRTTFRRRRSMPSCLRQRPSRSRSKCATLPTV